MDQTHEFIRNVVGIVNGITRTFITNQGCVEFLEQSIHRMESTIVNWNRVEPLFSEQHRELWESMKLQLSELLNTLKDSRDNSSATSNENQFRTGVNRDGKGRPAYAISEFQISHLIGLNFKSSEIASLLGVSRSTVKRRIKKYSLGIRSTYADISDLSLDQKVKEIVDLNKNIGYRSVRSRLDCSGFKVPYERVRQSMLRVDGASVALRWGNVIKRRIYRVKAPLELWHLDGNHKLIRWKIVVHGCIDGFSRLIVFLEAATNNRSETVLASFERAVEEFGLPSRIRCDQGVENVQVVEYMNRKRGRNRGSALIGRSVHNQRIERLWVDVYKGCLCMYHNLFTNLEEEGALDIMNETNMFALHYSFIPLIQRNLDIFAQAFNKHPLRTEHCKTPEQLYARGIIQNIHNNLTGLSSIRAEINDGAEEFANDTGQIPELATLQSSVNVPPVLCPLSDADFLRLKEHVSPLRDCTDNVGFDVYQKTVNFLRN